MKFYTVYNQQIVQPNKLILLSHCKIHVHIHKDKKWLYNGEIS